MARTRRRNPQIGGTLLLDADGVTKAAIHDRRVQAFLTVALRRDAEVAVSTVTLAEVLRGGSRDAEVHRVLKRVTKKPVTEQLARSAGELLGSTGMSATVDAIVAATARAALEPVVILTSDPTDLMRLTAGSSAIAVGHV